MIVVGIVNLAKYNTVNTVDTIVIVDAKNNPMKINLASLSS